MFAKLKALAKMLKRELAVYRRVLADARTPRPAKIFLGMAIGYLMMPFDLIPDWLPVIGQIDDVLIVPLCVYLALKMIPPEIIAEHREAVMQESRSATENESDTKP